MARNNLNRHGRAPVLDEIGLDPAIHQPSKTLAKSIDHRVVAPTGLRKAQPDDDEGVRLGPSPTLTPRINVRTFIVVAITFDPKKRDDTLAERQIDFADAESVFAGRSATAQDIRFGYGEARYLTGGFLRGRLVVVVWTPRGDDRHVISMRYCHAKEQKKWLERMD